MHGGPDRARGAALRGAAAAAGGHDRRRDRRDVRARCSARLGLDGARRTRASSALSGGQRKRVGRRPRAAQPAEPAVPRRADDRARSRARGADDGRCSASSPTASRARRHRHPRDEEPALCDELVVMGAGGVLCFQGTPDEALRFFGVESFDDDLRRARAAARRGVAARASRRLSARETAERRDAAPSPARSRAAQAAARRPRARRPLRCARSVRDRRNLRDPARPGAAARARAARRSSTPTCSCRAGSAERRRAAAVPARDRGDLARLDRRRARDHQGAQRARSARRRSACAWAPTWRPRWRCLWTLVAVAGRRCWRASCSRSGRCRAADTRGAARDASC